MELQRNSRYQLAIILLLILGTSTTGFCASQYHALSAISDESHHELEEVMQKYDDAETTVLDIVALDVFRSEAHIRGFDDLALEKTDVARLDFSVNRAIVVADLERAERLLEPWLNWTHVGQALGETATTVDLYGRFQLNGLLNDTAINMTSTREHLHLVGLALKENHPNTQSVGPLLIANSEIESQLVTISEDATEIVNASLLEVNETTQIQVNFRGLVPKGADLSWGVEVCMMTSEERVLSCVTSLRLPHLDLEYPQADEVVVDGSQVQVTLPEIEDDVASLEIRVVSELLPGSRLSDRMSLTT